MATKEELAEKKWVEARFRDYQKGYLVGASGETKLASLGCGAPYFEDLWEEGYQDGGAAYHQAMRDKLNYLRAQYSATKKEILGDDK